MIVRNEMPKKLFKNNILIKLPKLTEEEEEGLINSEEADGRTIVSMVAETCENVKEGDEVMISSRAQAITMVTIDGWDYAMFRESDVEGIW